MNTRIEKACLWSGYAFFVLYLLGIVVFAGFIPPPAPSWSGQAIADFFGQHQFRILVGMTICAFASVLYLPWGVSIFGEMLRMERSRFPLLSIIEVISAGLGAVFFAISPIMWLAIAYRTGHAADTVLVLNDFAWISWIVTWPFFALQAGVLGLCILGHEEVILPRWSGYFSIWFAVSMIPASLIVFFYHGPLTWNGILGLYLPLSMFAIWYQVMTYYVNKSISHRSGQDERVPVGYS